MKKKKILIIHHSGLIGGAGISLYNTWMELERKYTVVSYIPDDPPDLFNFLRDCGLDAHTFPFRLGKLTYYSGGNNLLKPRFWYHALHSLFQVRYWRRIIKDEKPDLVLVNSKVLCWMGKLFKTTKSLCFVRETIPGSPNKIMNRIMKNMLEQFTAVAFLSEYDLRQTALNKAKTIVSPDFLVPGDYSDKLGREEACKRLKIDSNSFNVLFVGGIDTLKGIDVAVESMSFLKNEDVKLIVAGKDFGDISYNGLRTLPNIIKKRKSIKFSNRVKKYIKEEKIENNIKFMGVQTDMSLLFSACDILIFPMKEAHQARPAFEIGVQKKPVIITDFDNISEFVQDGVNGLTFSKNDSKALAQSILKLKNDTNLLKRLGNANYDCTMKYHTQGYAMGILINKIDEILQ